MDDPELAYVMARYREVHDFWHVLSGLHTDVLSEIALKMFELLQTGTFPSIPGHTFSPYPGLPVCALSAVFGPLKLSMHEKTLLFTKYLPWVLKTYKKTPFLLNIYYEQHLETSIEQLRNQWGFTESLELAIN